MSHPITATSVKGLIYSSFTMSSDTSSVDLSSLNMERVFSYDLPPFKLQFITISFYHFIHETATNSLVFKNDNSKVYKILSDYIIEDEGLILTYYYPNYLESYIHSGYVTGFFPSLEDNEAELNIPIYMNRDFLFDNVDISSSTSSISFQAGLLVKEADIITNENAPVTTHISPSNQLPSGSTLDYSLHLHNQNSGIYDTLTGQEVLLTMFNNSIIGTITQDNTLLEVFRISIDPNSGIINFNLLRAVKHSLPGKDIITLPQNIVSIEVEFTVPDEQSRISTIDASTIIQILDDTPSLIVDLNNQSGHLINEGLLSSNAQSDTVNIAPAFIITADADGPNDNQSLQYQFRLAANGIDSGLIDTQTQQSVSLFLQGDTVYGTIDINDTPTTVFQFNLTSFGDLTFTLYRSVIHPNLGSDILSLSSGLVFVDATFADGDGDQTSAALDVGPITQIIDDIPIIGVNPAIADSTPTTDTAVEGNGALVGNWTIDAGVDGIGSLSVLIDANGDGNPESYSLGETITVRNNTQEIFGELIVNLDSSWQFTPGQNINQADTIPDSCAFQLVVSDGDGDTAFDSHTITIIDGLPPQVSALDNIAEITVDEANIETNVRDSITFTAGSDNLVQFGFTEDLSDLQVNTNGVAGADVSWVRVNENLIEGTVDGVVAMSIYLLPPAAPIAAFSHGDIEIQVTLSSRFSHADDNGKNNFSITGLIIDARDIDGDLTQASVNITVIDDIPLIDILPADNSDDTPATDTVIAGDPIGLSGSWIGDGGADGVNDITLQVDANGDGIIENYALDSDIAIQSLNGDFLGTLRVNSIPAASPEWHFVPANSIPFTGVFNFSLRISDNDADIDSDSHTITVLADTDGIDPNNATAELSLDERNISDSSSDTITFVTDTNPFIDFFFSQDLSLMTVNTNGTGGPDVVWTRVSDTVITGSVNGELALRLNLIAPGVIPAGISGDVSVEAILSENFIHVAGSENNTLTILGLSVNASDGVDTFSAAVIVNIIDDTPDIDIQPVVNGASPNTDTVTEDGAPLSGTWIKSGGADGIREVQLRIDSDGDGTQESYIIDHNNPNASLKVAVNNTGGELLGSLAIDSSGTWTFGPALGIDNDDAFADSFEFSLAIEDNDGDSAIDTHTIDITDGSNGQLIPGSDIAEITVNEANIADLNADTILFNAGSDPLVGFSFDISNITLDTNGVFGDDVSWRVNNGTIEGRVDGILAMTLTLMAPASISPQTTAGVTVTANLTNHFKHTSGNGINDVTIAGIEVIANDIDGGSVSAPVEITIIDDIPAVSIEPATADANPDDDTVTEDGILSGVWTLDGGADGVASIVIRVDSNSDGLMENYLLDHNAVNSSVQIPITNTGNDQLGVLTINNAGTWQFNPNLNVNNNDAFSDSFDFSLLVTDNDGDTVVDTHTVNIIDGTDGQLDPTNNSVDIAVDEANIIDSQPDTAIFIAGSDDLTTVRFTQDLSAMTVNTDGLNGADVLWIRVNDYQVEGYVDGNLALTLILNAPGSIATQTTASISVNAVLSDNFHHLAGNGTNTLAITGLIVEALDQEDEVTQAQVTVTIRDDIPTIETQPVSSDLLQVDESNLNTSDIADFSAFFIFDPGADGEQSRNYQLAINNANTGLIDTQSSETISLSLNGNQIEARTISGDLVFTLTVDANGFVSLNQLRAVVHSNPNDEVGLPASSIGLIASLIDNDNDVVNREIDISLAISLVDDAPLPTVDVNNIPLLSVDETDFSIDATASFTSAFIPNYGADGAGSVANYTLSVLSNGIDSGLDDTITRNSIFLFLEAGQVVGREGSDVVDAINGNAVFQINVDAAGNVSLNQLRAIIHPDQNNPNDASPVIQANLIRLTATVTDADGDSTPVTANIGSAFNFLDDGPSVVSPQTLGSVSSAGLSDDLLIVDESAGQQANPADNIADRLSSVDLFEFFDTNPSDGQADLDIDYGNDGPGTTVFSLSLLDGNNNSIVGVGSGLFALDPTDTTTGDGDGIGQGAEILLFLNGNVIEGRTNNAGGDLYFTISNSGSVLTLIQNNGLSSSGAPLNLWNDDTNTSDESVSLTGTAADGTTIYNIILTQTVTDADGDTAQALLNLTEPGGDTNTEYLFNFRDDGPTIDAGAVGAVGTVSVDETDLAINATFNFANHYATAIDYGTDGPGNAVYTLALAGANVGSGLYAVDNTDTTSSDGDGIGQGGEILLNQSGNVITGSVGGTDYFTITIEQTTGILTFDQLAAVWHANTNDPNDTSTINSATANVLTLTTTLTDADADTTTHSINLGQGIFTINDDGPVTTSQIENSTVTEANDTVLGNLLPLVNFNNDGQGFFQLVATADLSSTNLTNVTSFGENVIYQIVGNRLYGIGENSNVQIFSLTIEENGDYIFTLDRELDHPPGESSLNLDFSDAILAFDADGDPIALSSGAVAQQFMINVIDNPSSLYLSTVGGGAATTLLEGYYGLSAFSPVEQGIDQLATDLLAPGGLLFDSGLTIQEVLDLILAHEGIFSSSDILRLNADGKYDMAFNSSENFNFATVDDDINALIETTGLDVFNILSFYGFDIDALHLFNNDDFLFSFSMSMTDIINVLPTGLDTLVTNLLNLSDFGSEDVLRAQRQADGSYQFSVFFDGDTDSGLTDGTILDAPLSPSLQVAVDFNIDGISYEGDVNNGTLYFSLGELIDVDLETFLSTTLGLQPDILGSTLINGADVLSIDRVAGAWDTSTYQLVFKADDVGLNDVLLGNALQALGDPGLATLVSRLLDPDIQVIDIDSIHWVSETDINGDTVQTLYFSLRSLLDVDLPFNSIGELLNDPLDPLAAVSLRGEDILAISTNPGTTTWDTNSTRLYFNGSVYELNTNEELISGIFDNLVEDINAFSLSNNVFNHETLMFSTAGGGTESQVNGYDAQTLIQNYQGQFINSFDLSSRTNGTVTNQNINAVHVLSTGLLLFSLDAQATLPDIGLVDANTVIQWDGSTFSNYFTIANSDTGDINNITSFTVIEGSPDQYLFTIEQDAVINGTGYSNQDIIRYDGANYSTELLGTSAGINDLSVSIDVNAGVASGVDLSNEIDTVVTNLFQPLVDELQALFDAIYDPINADIDQLETILNTTTLLGSLLGIVNNLLNLTTTLTTNLLDGILGGDLAQSVGDLSTELNNFITDLDNLTLLERLAQDVDWAAYGGVDGVRTLTQGIVDSLSDAAFNSLIGEIDAVSSGIDQITADLNTALNTDTSLDFTLIDTRIDGLHQLPNGGDYLLSLAQQVVLDLQLTVNLDGSFIDSGALASLGVTVDTNQLSNDINTIVDTVVEPVLGSTDLLSVLQADVDLIGSNVYRYHDDGGGWKVSLYYDGQDHGLDNASGVDTYLDHVEDVLGFNSTLQDLSDNLPLLQIATDEDINAIHVFDDTLSGTTLNGSVGNDIVVGTELNDTIYGNKGNDVMIGNGGNNEFIFDSNSTGTTSTETDIILDFKEGDTLIFYEDIFGGATVDSNNINTYLEANNTNENTEITVLNMGFQPIHIITLTDYTLQQPISDISSVI